MANDSSSLREEEIQEDDVRFVRSTLVTFNLSVSDYLLLDVNSEDRFQD